MVRKPVVLEDGHLVTPADVARWLEKASSVLLDASLTEESPVDQGDVRDAVAGLWWALKWVRGHECMPDGAPGDGSLDEPDLWPNSPPPGPVLSPEDLIV